MSKRSRWLCAAVVLVLWGLITHGTSAGTGDEPHYQMMTYSLAFDRDLDLTNDYTNRENLALYGRFEAGPQVQAGKDGRLRSVHDIGMPLLFAPYYAVAYMLTGQLVAHVPARWLERARLDFNVLVRHFLSIAMIGFTAGIAVRLLEMFTALSVSSRRAFAWALLVVLSPPLMSHSFLFFTEILSAFIALTLFLWLRVVPRSRLEALLAGAAVGFLLLVHARNVGLVAGLLLMAGIRARRWTDRGLLMAFVIGAAILFAVRTGVTYHFWGTWLTTPQTRVGDFTGLPSLMKESATRITGWIFDQEDGLLPYAPIYLLAPAGWLALWRRDRTLCVEISIVVGAYVGVMTVPFLNTHGWRGGWSPAARYLLPIVPLLSILAFSAVAHMRRIPAIVLVIAGVQVCLDAFLWQHPRLMWNDGYGTSAFLRYLDGGTKRLSSNMPSLFPPVGSRTIAIIAATSIAWLILTAWLSRRERGLHLQRPA